MIQVRMTDISHGDVTVPGGWIARIPSPLLYPAEEAVYVSYFVRQGLPQATAEANFREAIEAMWKKAWLIGLREAVANAARRYRTMFPELELHGFDAAAVATSYVPGQNTGRRGSPALRALLVRMGEAEKARGESIR